MRAPAALLLVALAAPARAEEPALKTKVDEVAAQLQGGGQIVGLAIGVIDKGTPQTFTYGEAEAGTGQKVTPATVFQIGSVTKTFTATLLALLARRGVVRLDDPLQRWVPIGVTVPTYAGKAITLVDLATHTSGLPRGVPHAGTSLGAEQMWRFLAAYRLTRAPGELYEYSNLGFALLAHALMRATGGDYQNLVLRDVDDPLGLSDTRIQLTPDQAGRRAIGYGFPGFAARPELSTWPAFNGAGALRSTLADMMTFLAANLGLRSTILSPVLDVLQKRRHDAETPSTGVGLAWQMMPLAGSELTIIHKNGGTAGFFAYVAFVRSTKTGVVLLSNTRARKGRAALEILRFLNRDAVAADAAAVPLEEPLGDPDDPEAP